MMHSSQGWVISPGCSFGEIEMKTQPKKQKPKKKLDLELHFGEKPFVPFEADILAAEDCARIHRSRPLSPEHGLMVAILEVALADYQRCWKVGDKKGMERFADAQAWILESNSDWIFSFFNCCEALGIEPDYLRQGLLRWEQGRLTKPVKLRAIQQQKYQPKRMRQAA
jgi:hypothetical protein